VESTWGKTTLAATTARCRNQKHSNNIHFWNVPIPLGYF